MAYLGLVEVAAKHLSFSKLFSQQYIDCANVTPLTVTDCQSLKK